MSLNHSPPNHTSLDHSTAYWSMVSRSVGLSRKSRPNYLTICDTRVGDSFHVRATRRTPDLDGLPRTLTQSGLLRP
jgi:hypothetical protein